MGYSVECLRTDDISFCHFLNTTSCISRASHHKTPWSWYFLRPAQPRLRFVRVIAISFSFFGCRREKRHQFWLRHFRRLVYRISIVYAQSLSLRSEELDADTVYSFVPNIGDSDPKFALYLLEDNKWCRRRSESFVLKASAAHTALRPPWRSSDSYLGHLVQMCVKTHKNARHGKPWICTCFFS